MMNDDFKVAVTRPFGWYGDDECAERVVARGFDAQSWRDRLRHANPRNFLMCWEAVGERKSGMPRVRSALWIYLREVGVPCRLLRWL